MLASWTANARFCGALIRVKDFGNHQLQTQGVTGLGFGYCKLKEMSAFPMLHYMCISTSTHITCLVLLAGAKWCSGLETVMVMLSSLCI